MLLRHMQWDHVSLHVPLNATGTGLVESVTPHQLNNCHKNK